MFEPKTDKRVVMLDCSLWPTDTILKGTGGTIIGVHTGYFTIKWDAHFVGEATYFNDRLNGKIIGIETPKETPDEWADDFQIYTEPQTPQRPL